MQYDLPTILLGAIGTILTAVATWATERLIIWLNGKIKNEKASRILERAVTIVSNAVKSTYQTYVEGLKGTDAWTKETQLAALSKALGEAKSLLKKDAAKLIADTFGSVEEWIVNQIESEIFNLKYNSETAAK